MSGSKIVDLADVTDNSRNAASEAATRIGASSFEKSVLRDTYRSFSHMRGVGDGIPTDTRYTTEPHEPQISVEMLEYIRTGRLSATANGEFHPTDKMVIDNLVFDNAIHKAAYLRLPKRWKQLARTLVSIPMDSIVHDYIVPNQYPAALQWIEERCEVLLSIPTSYRITLTDPVKRMIGWRCFCNKFLSAEVPEELYLMLQEILRRRGSKCYGQYPCKDLFQPLEFTRLETTNTELTSGVNISKSSNPRLKPPAVGSSSTLPSPSSNSFARSSPQSGLSSAGNSSALSSTPINALSASASGSQPLGSTFSTATSTSIGIILDDLIVLFGIKGRAPTLEVETIDTKGCDDKKFFETARKRYLTARGWLRRLFSVWQLSHCNFVRISGLPQYTMAVWAAYKFKKYFASYVRSVSIELPLSHVYIYQQRPPAATPETQIDHHIWSVLPSQPCRETKLSQYFGFCVFWWMHEWFHTCVPALKPGRTDLLGRIPQKTTPWLIEEDGTDEAWGIQAVDSPSAHRLFVYYLFALSGPAIYWMYWSLLYNKDDQAPDLQNPSVPLLVALTISVTFIAVWQAMRSELGMKLRID